MAYVVLQRSKWENVEHNSKIYWNPDTSIILHKPINFI